ncbi:unnamed protein product [Porites evermanni]|uniref:Uncharacterized protein n=1 Tax=Porites evermanni TaxID=104178 RepID=A0ABN8SX27_9CNID|nr:unnamed protein product [Porites evermanni]
MLCILFNSTYFITAPSVFRPGQLFTLQVSLSSIVTTPVNITCEIVDTTKQNVLIASESGFFSAGTAQKLTLKIPHGVASDSGYYVLAVNGTGGATFSERKYIRFVEKGFTIYIQTDKAVYKPGQNVLMRIFAVHPDLKVYRGNDPNGNKMAHWVNLNSASGVIKREFLLSTQPVEGNWKISVSAAEDQKAEQVIEVKPYVLPKFEVKVELPPYLLEKEKALHGKVTVSSNRLRNTANTKGGTRQTNLKKTTMDYNDDDLIEMFKDLLFCYTGNAWLFKESFSWVRDTTIVYEYQYFVSVNATFHEDLTGKVASAQGSVSLHEMDVKLKFPDFNPGYFKPGLPFEVMLQVVKPNGDQHSPDTLKSMKVNIRTSYNWRQRSSEESVTPSEDGSIIIKRQIPSDAQNINLEVR